MFTYHEREEIFSSTQRTVEHDTADNFSYLLCLARPDPVFEEEDIMGLSVSQSRCPCLAVFRLIYSYPWDVRSNVKLVRHYSKKLSVKNRGLGIARLNS